MENLKFKGTKAVDIVENISDCGLNGIRHVGLANNIERELEAINDLQNLSNSMWYEAVKIDESRKELLEALQLAQKTLSTYNSNKSINAYFVAKQAIKKALK